MSFERRIEDYGLALITLQDWLISDLKIGDSGVDYQTKLLLERKAITDEVIKDCGAKVLNAITPVSEALKRDGQEFDICSIDSAVLTNAFFTILGIFTSKSPNDQIAYVQKLSSWVNGDGEYPNITR